MADEATDVSQAIIDPVALADPAAPPVYPKSRLVGRAGVIGMVVFYILLTLFFLVSMIELWPLQIAAGAAGAATSTTPTSIYLVWPVAISTEIRLILVVILSGALGSCIHAIRSLYTYIGGRELLTSWLAMYFMRPLVGAILALVFYFLLRGGFFSTGATAEQTSPYGFAATAALVGMFSEQAILKLKELAENLFTKPNPGPDPLKGTPQPPASGPAPQPPAKNG